MGLSRSRTITILVALAVVASNVLCSSVLHCLPDDTYHLTTYIWWYFHFTNIASVFGLLGAIREHALSITIYSNYLILDTILGSLPRFLVLLMLHDQSSSFCTLPSLSSSSIPTTPSQTPVPALPYTWMSKWTSEGCANILYLGQLTIFASFMATILLQIVGFIKVREYGRMLVEEDVGAEPQDLLSDEPRWLSKAEEGRLVILVEDSIEKA